jgi:hypothetical protein
MTAPDHQHIPFPLDTITGITAAMCPQVSAGSGNR